ncbi:MAG TPA: hypothetical protein VFE63_08625 [Roseiarcus sp.]|nr:hypothetical protein [Roseiarcus sp.]
MDEQTPRKRQATKFTRSARNKRIVERLREGFGYDEIAREEKLTERRVRQIVKEALEGREALESAIHAHLQIDRLGQAMRVAGEALARGDIRAIAPFIKALEKLDRYQSLARELAPRRRNMSDGDELVMRTLVARIRSEVLDECRREAAAAAAAAPPVDPRPAPDEGPAAIAPPLAPELEPAASLPAPDEGPAVAPPLAPVQPDSPWGTWAR